MPTGAPKWKNCFRRYVTSQGRMAFKKYPNCRHKFSKTRPLARFKRLGGKIHFQGGNIFVFIICLKQFFLSITKFGGYFPRLPPVATGLDTTIAKKCSIGGLHICAGARHSENLYLILNMNSICRLCKSIRNSFFQIPIIGS